MSFKDFAKKSADIGRSGAPSASEAGPVKPSLAATPEKESAGPPNKTASKT